MIEIKLTFGKVAVIDDYDFETVNIFKWYASLDANRNWVAATHPKEYLFVIKMHRFILGVTDPKIQVDHINGNMLDEYTIDNRRSNLRICNNSENNCNKPKRSGDYSSQFKGVCWDFNRNKWMAYCNKDGFRINIGRFDSELEAAEAYNKVALNAHGEFAFLNELTSSGVV